MTLTNAEQVGLAAMRWRRLDVAALELESRTSPTASRCWPIPSDYAGDDPALRAVDKAWKAAHKAAADAHDEFMSLLAHAVTEQEDLFA